MYKLYFDGSGEKPFRTLACCAGEDNDWEALNREWGNALKEDGRQPSYMHMKDAMQGVKGYSGWRVHDVRKRIERLLQVMENFKLSSLRAYVISVEIAPYDELKGKLELGVVEQTCLEWALIRAVQIWEEENGFDTPQPLKTFFYRNERYLTHWQRFWETNKPLRKFVQQPRQVDMRQFPAVQIADMLSWSSNRLLTCPGNSVKTTVAHRILYPPRFQGKAVPVIERAELLRHIALQAKSAVNP